MSSLLDSIARRRRASAKRRLGPPPSAQLPAYDYRAAEIKGYAERTPARPTPPNYGEPHGEIRAVPAVDEQLLEDEVEVDAAIEGGPVLEPELATGPEPEMAKPKKSRPRYEEVADEFEEAPLVTGELEDELPQDELPEDDEEQAEDELPEDEDELPEQAATEPAANRAQPPLPRPLATTLRAPHYTALLPNPNALGTKPAPLVPRPRQVPVPAANTSVRVLPPREVAPVPSARVAPAPRPEPEPIAPSQAVTRPVPVAVPARTYPLPKVLDRTQLRRRARYLRQLRELQIRDLGGFALELHRFGRDQPELIAAKLQAAAETDLELRGLEQELDGHSALSEIRLPGIGGVCSNCGTVYGSADRFCASCGEEFGQ